MSDCATTGSSSSSSSGSSSDSSSNSSSWEGGWEGAPSSGEGGRQLGSRAANGVLGGRVAFTMLVGNWVGGACVPGLGLGDEQDCGLALGACASGEEKAEAAAEAVAETGSEQHPELELEPTGAFRDWGVAAWGFAVLVGTWRRA